MIVSPTMALETETINSMGIGKVVPEEEISNLKKILEAVDPSILKANLERPRKSFAYYLDSLRRIVWG